MKYFFTFFILFSCVSAWSNTELVWTENEALLFDVQNHFKKEEFSIFALREYLFKNDYYLAEIKKQDSKIIIKNPYQVIFIIKGNHFLNEKEIRQIIKIDANKIGSFFYSFVERQLKTAYQKKGFLKIRIDKTEGQKDWKKWLTLKISEGQRTRLNELKVEGLLSKPSRFYKNIILQKSPELSRGFFNKEELELAYESLVNHLKSEGYLQSKIRSDRIFFEGNQVSVLVNLEEGPLTFITDIQIKGIQKFTISQLLSQMKSQVRSPLKVEILKKDLQNIENFYKEKGYLQVKILNRDNVIQYDPVSKSADILIQISENQQFFISKISIRGLKKVKRQLVKNLLQFKPGEVLTKKKIERSIQLLAGTGLFSNVNINEKFIDNQMEVDVLLEERRPRSLRGGAGVNSQRGVTIRAYSELTHRNLLGYGRALVLKGSGQVSLIQREPFIEYEVSGRYKEIFSIGKGYEGNMSLSQSKNIFRYGLENIDFVEKRQLSFFINKDIAENLKLRWNILSFENRVEDCTHLTCASDPQQISDTSLLLSLDKRDNIFNPMEGYLLNLKTELASPYLGSSSDIAFLKMDVSSYFYLSFLEKYTIGFGLKGGFISSVQNSNYMPVSRSFILGGQSSLRGYDGNIEGERIPREKYSPIQTANESLKLQIGGSLENVLLSHYTLFKVDVRFPILKDVKGILFYDLGTVYLESKSNNLLDYGHSIGLGFRYETFFIPVGLDIAYQLPPRECIQLERGECSDYRFHFSIGL